LVAEDQNISKMSWKFYEKPKPADCNSWITTSEEEVTFLQVAIKEKEDE